MRIHVVDAFTERTFAGNPAAVCPLSESADAGWMQRVAAEMNLSETAFPRPIDDPQADFELRWFTPKAEVALCGHATLATAHVLYETGVIPRDQAIRFRTRSGVLTVRRDGERLAMDFPACPAEKIDLPGGLAEALGATPGWTGRNTQNDILALLDDPATVRELVPDTTALLAVDARGICVTAAGDGEYDFISRFFAPSVGIPEDPVTGSAHCMLAPFWAERLARTEMRAHQASHRGGDVHVTVTGDRVTLRGSAVSVIDGTLHTAPD
jgi:PhzF family phenazine biosynthesis protein